MNDIRYAGESGPARENITGEADRSYFAKHDEARAGRGARTTASPLEELRLRLSHLNERANEALHGTAALLEEHADRVHGALPNSPEGSVRHSDDTRRDYGPGVLGDVFRAMDRIEYDMTIAIERLAQTAWRNSTLA